MRTDRYNAKTKHGKQTAMDLNGFLDSQKPYFERDLIPDLDFISHQAENHTGIEVVSVDHHINNEYTLTYRFDWSVYNGCSDMDESGTVEANISFTVHTDRIEFDLSAVASRSTMDEL